MGGKILQKWGFQTPFNPYNYLRGRVWVPTQQNSQTHSNNNSFTNFQQIVWACLTTLWGWHIVTLHNLCDFEKKKQVLYFLYIYIYTIYPVNTGKRQCSTWKDQKTSSNEPSLKSRVQKLHFKISVTEDPSG